MLPTYANSKGVKIMVAEGNRGLEAALEEMDEAKEEYRLLEQQILDCAYGRVPYGQSYEDIMGRLKDANERVMEAISSLRPYLVRPSSE